MALEYDERARALRETTYPAANRSRGQHESPPTGGWAPRQCLTNPGLACSLERMQAVRWIGISLGLALALTGCGIIPTRPPASSFFVARLQDCKSEAPIPPRDKFAAGEVPAIVLVNYAGRTVTIRVNDAISGAMFWHNTGYLPQDRATAWWSLKTLPTGTYKAELVMGGTVLQTCEFEVNNPVSKGRSPAQR